MVRSDYEHRDLEPNWAAGREPTNRTGKPLVALQLGRGVTLYFRCLNRSLFPQSLLSLSPELPSDLGETESSTSWASSGPWSLSSSDSSLPEVAARLPGRSTSLVEGRSCGWVPPPPGFAPLAPRPSSELSPSPTSVLRQSISFSGLPSGRRTSPPPASLAGPSVSSWSFSPSSSPPPPPGDLLLSPSAFSAAPGTPVSRRDPTPACCPSCRRATPNSVWGPVGGLARSPSAHSLGSDPDEYASSGSSLGGSDSPVFEAGVFGPPQPPAAPRRLPIFNRISVSE
ncbi:PREDICTED: tristetraprolin [Bison bison bison]|uniref:Tristetraprolin n=1 Tax=Bison bison bison TaxID=43346 RepID=A0A6P3I7B9_BISBB|nr:PREDICTED: tristetraprolin [Bison bison bison]